MILVQVRQSVSWAPEKDGITSHVGRVGHSPVRLRVGGEVDQYSHRNYPIPQQNKNAVIGHIHISITAIIGRIERAIKGSRFESRYDYPVLGSSTLSLTIPLYAPGQSSRRKVKEVVIRSSVESVWLQEIRPIGDPPAVENNASDSIRAREARSGLPAPHCRGAAG